MDYLTQIFSAASAYLSTKVSTSFGTSSCTGFLLKKFLSMAKADKSNYTGEMAWAGSRNVHFSGAVTTDIKLQVNGAEWNTTGLISPLLRPCYRTNISVTHWC